MVELIVFAVVLTTSVWVYLDATGHKIGKVAEAKGLFNLSAGAWAAVTLLLWIIGFPAYLIKRGALIERAKEHPVVAKGRGGKAAALSIVGGLWMVLVWAGTAQSSLPACNSPEVVALAEKVVRDAPLVKATGLAVKGISYPAERGYDRQSDKRFCRAMLATSLGEEAIAYSVEWHDRSQGLIWVAILEE